MGVEGAVIDQKVCGLGCEGKKTEKKKKKKRLS